MQKERHTDFDLGMREIFQNAEEQVPSRLWESISTELDRRDRRKVIALRWRRAAAGVAAAAAVMSGIFMIDRNNDGLLEPVPSQIVADVHKNEVKEALESADLTIEDQIAASSQLFLADIPQATGPVSTSVKPSEAVPAESFDATVVEEAENIEAASGKETAGQPVAVVDVPEPIKDETWTDPFAGLDDEEKRPGRSISFTLSGNVMSNDATSNGTRSMHASPIGLHSKTGITEKSISTYGIPLSFGIGARIQLDDRWSLGTGVDWTLLTRTFTGIYTEVGSNGTVIKSINSDITNELHYIGIPLNLYFNVLTNRDIKFYVWGGASAEKGILNKYRIHSEPEDIFYKEGVNGIQWSAGLGLGLEFALNDWLGLYIDPSARYYFDCDQPNSVRTAKPYMLNFEAGLRFNL